MPNKAKRVKSEHGSWQAVAKEAERHRDLTLANVKPHIPDVRLDHPKNALEIIRATLCVRDREITELPAQELLERIRNCIYTVEAVTRAFLQRAGLAQQLTNCVTELLPQRALARARYLDNYLDEHDEPIGPLHGLPISVKEHIGMKGLGLSAGYVAWWNNAAPDEDARVLQMLSRAGAVFHARTTQPQTLMHLETDSNLYGVTVNPYNTDLSAGGSSGGEGALIGARGSCLGIGTDVGGSIRSPAAHNGIYGLKPTAFRIPTDGWSSTPPAPDPISTVVGPLSTSLGGIKLFMEAVLSAKPWLFEPALLPIPWNTSHRISSQTPLKIGIMWLDEQVQPHPPITRALRTVASKLAEVPNITLVDWKPHVHDEAWAITSSLYFTDGGAEDAAVMAQSGEPWRPLTKWMIEENPGVKKLKMKELWYWLEEREGYRSEYAKVWNDTATGTDEVTGEPTGMVDAILCPVGPSLAPKHDTAKYWSYTSQWNLLDYPAISFPVCKADKELDVMQRREGFLGDHDRENWNLWDPEEYHGLPVSLQLVSRRFDDEKIIAILEYIIDAIGLPLDDFS